MTLSIEMIKEFYKNYGKKVESVRDKLGRAMTYTEKILYSHLHSGEKLREMKRGEDYTNFKLDRVAMQDATAQMALLQLMQTGIDKVKLPSSVHTDHLIWAENGSDEDIAKANKESKEIYGYLSSVSKRYGIDYWRPGAGIIHQVILENYAFPGGMLIGTDSHTVNGGGLGMVSIGVGGADALDAMIGLPWEVKFPKLLGVKLTGKLGGWTSSKDIILKLAGILTVKGGTGKILEYFGEGTENLSATGKATITNMGAEIGATTSIFPYDQSMYDYLVSTGRKDVADMAKESQVHLMADKEVFSNPQEYFDEIIEIDLDTLEPHINGPFTPDKAWSLNDFSKAVVDHDYPAKLKVGLIGSCTNSSYEDLSRVLSIFRQAKEKNISLKSNLTLTPGSEGIKKTIDRDGMLREFRDMGASVLANACGPCIGLWKRKDTEGEERNSIITSFNRNFSKRNDGNPNTHSFVSSPEIVALLSLTGDLKINPLKDGIINDDGEKVFLDDPVGEELPKVPFEKYEEGLQKSTGGDSSVEVKIDPNSKRLQELTPFEAWNQKDITRARLLIKVKGKCTTDHISMAGPWLQYRGHLENISQNLLIGATNAFNEKINLVKSADGSYMEVPKAATSFMKENIPTIVIGDENYGEGSSREHAAMEPRFLGVRVVVVKSFARIHESNLKKQGVLPFTFKNPEDWGKIQEEDEISIIGLKEFRGGGAIHMLCQHKDGSSSKIDLEHTMNDLQVKWFEAGSALNHIRNMR